MSRRRTLTPIEAIVQFCMRGPLSEVEQALGIAKAIVTTRQTGQAMAPRVRRPRVVGAGAQAPALAPLPPMPRPPRPLVGTPDATVAPPTPPAPPRPRRRRGQGKPRPSRARRQVHVEGATPSAPVEAAVDLPPLPDQGDPYEEDVPLPME